MWDIDGTLLTTGRAGIYAWEEAARIVLGRQFDFSKLETAGLTDMEIAARILQSEGRDASHEEARALTDHYERLLPSALPRRQGSVIKGVAEILAQVGERSDILSMLLTGNTMLGAKAKLGYYGLARFFEIGAYSGEFHERVDVARHALSLATNFAGNIPSERVFVIGDTPHDIACGKAIGVRTVAVATGTYDAASLAAHGPWRLLEEFPDPPAFVALLDGQDSTALQPSGEYR